MTIISSPGKQGHLVTVHIDSHRSWMVITVTVIGDCKYGTNDVTEKAYVVRRLILQCAQDTIFRWWRSTCCKRRGTFVGGRLKIVEHSSRSAVIASGRPPSRPAAAAAAGGMGGVVGHAVARRDRRVARDFIAPSPRGADPRARC